jgi:hypothetical protein
MALRGQQQQAPSATAATTRTTDGDDVARRFPVAIQSRLFTYEARMGTDG